MSLVVLVLLGLGVADLVRWTPGPVRAARTAAALVVAALVVGATALAGHGLVPGRWLAAVAVAITAAWLFTDGRRAATDPRAALVPLGVLAAAVVAVVALSPHVPATGGVLVRWYVTAAPPGLLGSQASAARALGFLDPTHHPTSAYRATLAVTDAVPLDVPLLAVAGALALLATANRVVRLVLLAASAAPASGEEQLRGGRLLGPLERLFILGLALSGDLTAAAVVIAAKGVLRLPEIRSARAERRGAPDTVTEYFLVGTFTSWLLAVAVAGLVALAR